MQEVYYLDKLEVHEVHVTSNKNTMSVVLQRYM